MAPSTAAKGAVRATGGAAAKGAVRATGGAAAKGAERATGGAAAKGALQAKGGAAAKRALQVTGGAAAKGVLQATGGAAAKGTVRATGSAAASAVGASTAGALNQILKDAGFTPVGPAAGSYAAAWMSSTADANGGGVPAGSLYSAVQSTAMGGSLLLAAPAVKTVGVVSGAGAGAVVIKKKILVFTTK